MRSRFVLILLVLSHFVMLPAELTAQGASNLPDGYQIELYLDDLTFPITMDFAPDGRLFFTERYDSLTPPLHGLIRVVTADGLLQAEPFAQLPVPDEALSKDVGLMGMALDPDFSNNGYLYAYHASPPDATNPNAHNQLVRYTATLIDGNWVGSDLTIIVDDLPASIDCCHNGGVMTFGADGKLYFSLGDTHDQANGQNLATRAATIMRINPDGTIPADNPFVNVPNADPAIYAYGLRNVFGMAWDPTTGKLFASDNGPNCNDELNQIVAGGNYGWDESDDGDGCRTLPPPYIEPIFRWEDTIGPTGMDFYNGGRLGAFEGDLFAAAWNGGTSEYGNGVLFQIGLTPEGNVASLTDLLQNCGQSTVTESMLDVKSGIDGYLYFSCQEEIYPTPLHTGAIYRIVAPNPTPTAPFNAIRLNALSTPHATRLALYVGIVAALVGLAVATVVARQRRG